MNEKYRLCRLTRYKRPRGGAELVGCTLRHSSGVRRDVPLPYGNKLVLIREGNELFVRLLLLADGRRTFVTPHLLIWPADVDRLLSGAYVAVDLGGLRLLADQRDLIICFEYRRIPVAHSVWHPVADELLHPV